MDDKEYTQEEKQKICEDHIKDCAGCPLNDCGARK